MAAELGAFLRARRARLSPEDAGLPPGPGRRRIPGLRREELATLAGVSIDYYVRLEQGRERNPSPQVVAALAQALHLNDEEHAHLLVLVQQANQAAPPPAAPSTRVRASIRQLLETVRPSPAYVLGRNSDILAANPEVLGLFAGMTDWPSQRRNTVRYTFTHPQAHDLLPDWEDRAARAVANLRTVAAQYPQAHDVTALIDELSAASADFTRLWQRHDVRRRRSEPNDFNHPRGGPLSLTLDVLYIEEGQRIGIYQAVPGSPDHYALTRLATAAGADL